MRVPQPVFLTSAFLAVLACTTTPVTNRKAFDFVPDSQLNQLGINAYQEVLQTERISQSPAVNDVVERVGRRIAAATGQNFDWQFTVIDKPDTVNAFCLPGGKVAVYTGILPVAATEGGLAAVLGHEIGHAVARHAGERLSQALAAQVGLTLADLTLANSDHRQLIMGALGLGAQFGVLLPYGRVQESEADHIGLVYMAKAGYDPTEALGLWQRMQAAEKTHPPEFLSTHPSPETRIADIQRELPEAQGFFVASDRQNSTTPLVRR